MASKEKPEDKRIPPLSLVAAQELRSLSYTACALCKCMRKLPMCSHKQVVEKELEREFHENVKDARCFAERRIFRYFVLA